MDDEDAGTPPVQAEAHVDLAALGAADRRQNVDALDAGQRILERHGDLALDDLGARAAIGRVDRDDRLVDVGIFADGEPLIGDEPDERDSDVQVNDPAVIGSGLFVANSSAPRDSLKDKDFPEWMRNMQASAHPPFDRPENFRFFFS